MSLRVCMIGCGAFARLFHGPAQKRCAGENAGIELAACCDRDGERASSYARDFGFARHHLDAEEMLTQEKPDAVILAVPPELTAETASRILARGFPLLLEKPPGTTSQELTRLICVAKEGKVQPQVAFNRRYMPVLKRAREILVANFAETITSIDYQMVRHERWDRDFSTTAVHAIDAVRFLAGCCFRSVVIAPGTQPDRTRRAMNVDLDIECVSRARARITVRPVAGYNAESAVIHGLGQTLKVEIPFPNQPCTEGRVEHWRAGECIEVFTDAGCDAVEKMGVYGETRAFFDTVRAGGTPEPTLRDCGQQVALMEALRLEKSGWIELSLP